MKTLALAAALTCLTAPAFAQTVPCNTGLHAAEWEFVEPFNTANDDIARNDYAAALNLAALASPHAMSLMQRNAVTQIEATAYVGLNDRPAASTSMKSALFDSCLQPEVSAARRDVGRDDRVLDAGQSVWADELWQVAPERHAAL